MQDPDAVLYGMSSSSPPPYVTPLHDDIVTFAIVPTEFVVACLSILNAVHAAIEKNTPPEDLIIHAVSPIPFYCREIESILQDEHIWPLVVDRNSPLSHDINGIGSQARIWLERSPIFDHYRNDLSKFLQPPTSFKASRLRLDKDGLLEKRDVIHLRQQVPPVYVSSTLSIEDLCSQEHIKTYLC